MSRKLVTSRPGTCREYPQAKRAPCMILVSALQSLTIKCGLHAKLPPRLVASTAAYNYVLPHFAEHIQIHEACRAILLDANSRPKGVYTIGTGGITSCLTDVRLLFCAALLSLSTGIILVHNHPSGNTEPSAQDLEFTERVRLLGQLHKITLLDHLILVPGNYTSLRERGLL